MASYVNPPYIFMEKLNLNFFLGNIWFLWYPMSQKVEIQLPMITIMLPFIVNLIQDKF